MPQRLLPWVCWLGGSVGDQINILYACTYRVHICWARGFWRSTSFTKAMSLVCFSWSIHVSEVHGPSLTSVYFDSSYLCSVPLCLVGPLRIQQFSPALVHESAPSEPPTLNCHQRLFYKSQTWTSVNLSGGDIGCSVLKFKIPDFHQYIQTEDPSNHNISQYPCAPFSRA